MLDSEAPAMVKVTPLRLQILVVMGGVGLPVMAERLAEKLMLEEGDVVDALDGLIDAGVVDHVDLSYFHLTEYGSELYLAIYDAAELVI